jgi:hypothetical protein
VIAQLMAPLRSALAALDARTRVALTAAAAVGAAHTLLAHLTHAGSLSTAAAQQVRALRGAEGARERVRGGA